MLIVIGVAIAVVGGIAGAYLLNYLSHSYDRKIQNTKWADPIMLNNTEEIKKASNEES